MGFMDCDGDDLDERKGVGRQGREDADCSLELAWVGHAP